MKKILIVDNAVDHEHYRPVENWSPHLALPYDSIYTLAERLPLDTGIYSHIIISGSEASILSDDKWILELEKWTRRQIAAGKVILGSCFGHQMIARALWGKKCVRRMPKPEAGWACIENTKSDPIFGKICQTNRCFTLHYDEVCDIPTNEAEVLATNGFCRIQALRLKSKPVWGLQPHPEIGIDEGLDTLKRKAAAGDADNAIFESALLSGPNDSGWLKTIIEAFEKA